MVRAGLSLEPLPQGCTPGLDQSLVGRQCLDHPCRAGGKDRSKLGGGLQGRGPSRALQSSSLGKELFLSSAQGLGRGSGLWGAVPRLRGCPGWAVTHEAGAAEAAAVWLPRPSRCPRLRQELPPVPGLAGIQAPGATAWPSSLASSAPPAKRVPQHPASRGRTAPSAGPWRVRPAPTPVSVTFRVGPASSRPEARPAGRQAAGGAERVLAVLSLSARVGIPHTLVHVWGGGWLRDHPPALPCPGPAAAGMKAPSPASSVHHPAPVPWTQSPPRGPGAPACS